MDHPQSNHLAFWGNFGITDLSMLDGAKVLEIGCGRGGRSIEMASLGAQVIGIDIMESCIDDARSKAKALDAETQGRIRYEACELRDVADDDFDIVISEDAFEHIENVGEVLLQIRDRLKVDGKAYIGFGPLYHSPFGDHGWMRAVLPFRKYFPWPWGHLYLRNFAFKKLSEQHGVEVKDTFTWPYLVLNEKTVDEYLALFEKSGLQIASIEFNPAKSLVGKLFKLAGTFKPTRKYFTWAICAVLEKPISDAAH